MKKDVMIGYPVYDGRAEVLSIQAIIKSINRPDCCAESAQYLIGDSLVTRARNRIVAKFMESECNYLMFIDSDIHFDPLHINMLREHDKDVIGGVYLKKKLPYAPVMNRRVAVEGSLVVCHEIGTGFMMIHRRVFDAIRAMAPEHAYKPENDEPNGSYYDYFRVGVRDGRYLSEDYYFSYLAQDAGFKCYLNPDVLVTHIGKATYPFPDAELIGGACELIRNYDPNREMPKETDRLYEAINIQRGLRNDEGKGKVADEATNDG